MSEKTIHQALVAAQNEVENPLLDSENPHYHSRYASLASVRDAVVPVFNKHGIAIIQKSEAVDNKVSVHTILIHESGAELDCGIFTIPIASDNPQAYCSAWTYARRYTLQAIAGCVGDVDDDGNAASKAPEPTIKPSANTQKATKAPEPSSPDEGSQESGFSEAEGTVDKVAIKTGTGKKGEWKKYGVMIDGAWYSTFDEELGVCAESLKGKKVYYSYVRNGKFNDIKSMVEA